MLSNSCWCKAKTKNRLSMKFHQKKRKEKARISLTQGSKWIRTLCKPKSKQPSSSSNRFMKRLMSNRKCSLRHSSNKWCKSNKMKVKTRTKNLYKKWMRMRNNTNLPKKISRLKAVISKKEAAMLNWLRNSWSNFSKMLISSLQINSLNSSTFWRTAGSKRLNLRKRCSTITSTTSSQKMSLKPKSDLQN